MPQEIMCDDGSFTLISDEHLDAVQYFNLRCVSKVGIDRPNAKSAVRFSKNTGKGKTVYLHRFIMERVLGRKLRTEEIIDHVNGNPLDNTNENLRVATKMQNSHNTTPRGGIHTRYKGVHWLRRPKNWQARITVNKKVIYLGVYPTDREAAIAYNQAALKYFGEFARLNVIDH